MSRNVTVEVLREHIGSQLAGRFADVAEADAIAAELSQSIVKDICPHLKYNRTSDGYSRKQNRRTPEARAKDNVARRNRYLRKRATDAAAAAAAVATYDCVLGVCVCGGEECEVC
jgi:hypothetical protein